MTKASSRIAMAALLGLATLPLLLAPAGAYQFSARTKEIGTKVKCMCGSCSMSAAGCSHPGGEFSGPCPTAKGMLQQIDQHIAKGEADERIMQAFVEEFGTTVYAEPPKSGFSLVAWVMPTAYLVAGAVLVVFVISRWVKKNAPEGGALPGSSSAATRAISPELLERARKLAERETEE